MKYLKIFLQVIIIIIGLVSYEFLKNDNLDIKQQCLLGGLFFFVLALITIHGGISIILSKTNILTLWNTAGISVLWGKGNPLKIEVSKNQLVFEGIIQSLFGLVLLALGMFLYYLYFK